ncbi:MAG: D-alanine--D-alanine ligase [Alphaproteobacteria bacterium]|nr:D-alanine--D-alanine ligase [Alphaproteobacteria bacterium]
MSGAALEGKSHWPVMHAGMPPFDPSGPPLSFYEFWRPKYFYVPVFLHWVWLSVKHGGPTLPTIANPLFPMGGLVGESKRAILDQVGAEGRPFVARYISHAKGLGGDPKKEAEDVIARAAEVGIAMPFVAKPDIGCRGVGVRKITTLEALAAYVAAYPPDHTIIVQELIDLEPEAGVFYIREPGEARGRLFSLTLKYFPYVVGDGRSSLQELIARDPRAGRIAHVYLPRHRERLERVLAPGEPFRLAFAGSHSRGTIFRDGAPYVTEAMTEAFDRIAKTIPEFYFGRFDVRFTDIAALQKGEGFRIVEINGAGGEATHIWDRKTSIWTAYRTLMEQYAILWRIGAANRRRGFRPVTLWQLWRAYRSEQEITPDYPLND